MGSLSNLFISQSYISLIHLGSNNTASSTPTELEDGLGNGVGVSVSTNGNLYVSGNVYATNLTGSTINTGSLVTTSSFNAYTSSNDSKVNSLIAATASYAISSSVKTVTDNLQTQINGLATTSSVNSISTSVGLLQTFSGSQYKADSASFSSRILAVTGSSINTGSFATTGSNTFTGTNSFSGAIDTIAGISMYQNGLFMGYPKQMGDPFDTNISISTPRIIGQSSSGNNLILAGDTMNSKGVTILNGLTVSGSLFLPTRQVGMSTLPSNITASGDISASGNIYAANLTGSSINTGSFITTGSATTASQTILGDFKFDTTYTASNPYTSQNGGSNVVYVSYGDIFNGTQSGDDFIYWLDTNFTGVTVSGTGITNGAITTYNYGSEVEVTITTGTITNGASYTFIGPAFQTIEVTGSIQATRPLRVVNPSGTKGELDGNGMYGRSADGNLQAGASWDSGVYSANNSNGNFILFAASSSQVTNNSGATPFDTIQIAANQNNNGRFTQISFEGNNNYTNGRITVHQPLFVSQSLSVTGSATFSELTGSLGAFSASVNNRLNSGGTSGGATTGSNTFTGDQTILGSIVSNPTTSLTELFSQAFVSGAVQYNITASAATSASNLVFGGVPLASVQTGSVIISGSSNLLFNPSKTNLGAAAFTRGYVNGISNYFTTIPTLHTQSLFNPTTQANIGTGALIMNFITSSLGVPFVVNNNFSSQITLNHQSGTMQMQNNISNGAITSTQNGLTAGTVAATFNSNTIGGGGITLNHTSSSIQTSTNAVFGTTTVNNNYYHTGSNNSLTFAANLTNGQTIVINAGGSPSTNVARPIVGNLLGGSAITVQADAVGTDSAGLRNEIVYGYNLIVSGAQSTAATTNQGGAFFGRYNDINNMYADSGKTIFAVGTGTSTSARKTALSIDSASVVNISGSLTITGSNLNIDGSGNISGSSYYAIANAGFRYAPSTSSLDNSYTRYGKDGFQIYQYQNQPYAFGVICTADQLNAYTGSQFRWGTVNSLGPIVNYMNMISASYTGSIGGGGAIPGLDYLKDGEILQINRGTTFDKNVYIQQGLYVSQSMGGATPAITINGGGATTALLVTGSVAITGSLTVNGNSVTSLGAGAFYSSITQSGSAAVSQSMTFNNTDISEGVSVNSGTQLTVTNAGTYNIQFSAQVLADTGSDTIWIWLKKNGANVNNSTTKLVLANNAAAVAAWNFVVDAGSGDYFELVWQSLNGDAVLLRESASGNYPSIPSVIATVTQVN